MPIFVPIVIGVVAASGAVTVSQSLRTKKFQKVYKEAYAHTQEIQASLQEQDREFNRQAGEYSQAKALAALDLQKAVDFLQKAKMKYREFQVDTAAPELQAGLERIEFQAEVLHTVLRTAGGPAAAAVAAGAPAGIYTAVGLFEVASTGTPIASLSGTAAHSTIMAAIGRAGGGAGLAAGATTLSTISLSLNIVTLPLSVGAAFWSIKKGNDVKKQIEKEIQKMATAETSMARQSALMNAVMHRMSDNRQSIAAAQNALTRQLNQSDPGNLEQTHGVYRLADLLAYAIDAEVITPAQARELGIKINAPALPGAPGAN